jgi:hypothetical protein
MQLADDALKLFGVQIEPFSPDLKRRFPLLILCGFVEHTHQRASNLRRRRNLFEDGSKVSPGAPTH